MTKLAIVRRQSIRAMITLIARWPNENSGRDFEIADRFNVMDVLPGTLDRFLTSEKG